MKSSSDYLPQLYSHRRQTAVLQYQQHMELDKHRSSSSSSSTLPRVLGKNRVVVVSTRQHENNETINTRLRKLKTRQGQPSILEQQTQREMCQLYDGIALCPNGPEHNEAVSRKEAVQVLLLLLLLFLSFVLVLLLLCLLAEPS